ncbi:MAG: hypothetical protein IJI20_00625 [Firmicutes bacterium]|nr:hypothetical protein [Bacillota bacterium]
MERKRRIALAKKVTAFAMALMVGITFIPLMDGIVFADDQGAPDKTAAASGNDTKVDVDLSALPDDGSVDKDAISKSIKESVLEAEQPPKKGKEAKAVDLPEESVVSIQGETDGIVAQATDKVSIYNVAYSANGVVTFEARANNTSGPTLEYVYIDNGSTKGLTVISYPAGHRYVKASFDLKTYYSIGRHTLYAEDSNGNIAHVSIVRGIYDTPGNGEGQYETYSNYMFYWPSGNYLYGCDLYLDVNGQAYKVGSSYGKWSVGGLTPNSSVWTRAYFGKWVNGEFFRGPYSPTVTMLTGGNALAIKSVKVKAVKVKKHKIRHHTYWGWGTWTHWTEKYWTYKLKVTVKLKKKPGASGLVISGSKVWGNKKKYNKTFGTFVSYKKPRKQKVGISIYSFKNVNYGAYSPMWSKNKKVK